MFPDYQIVKAETDYRRDQLSKIYPKKRVVRAESVRKSRPHRSLLGFRKVWSA